MGQVSFGIKTWMRPEEVSTKDEVDKGVDVKVFTIMQRFLPSTCLHTNKITRKRREKGSENVASQEMHVLITVSEQMKIRI